MFRDLDASIGIRQALEKFRGSFAITPQAESKGSLRFWGPALAVLLLAGSLPGCGVAEPARSIATVVAGFQDTPYGKLAIVNQDNGELVTFDQSSAVRAKFIAPVREFERSDTSGRIIVRREPSIEKQEVEALWPSQIKTDYVVRVFGGGYSDYSGLGEKKTVYKGQEYQVGLWFAFSNEKGKFVSPQGIELKSGEKPYYVAASSVTVLPKEEVKIQQSLVSLEPVGFYKGSIAVSKEVNIRSGTQITSEHPTETNVISWDKIISLNGVNVTEGNSIVIQNPLVVDGENPTEDPSVYPSKWMAFWAELLVQERPRSTRLVKVYINISRKTVPQYVQPDSPSWDRNIVGIQAVNGSLTAKNPGANLPAVKDLAVVNSYSLNK